MKPREVLTGLPGHPTYPPLTDATIGLCFGAAAFAVLSAIGVSKENLAIAWWLALVAGLVVTVPTAASGLLDWLRMSRRCGGRLPLICAAKKETNKRNIVASRATETGIG